MLSQMGSQVHKGEVIKLSIGEVVYVQFFNWYVPFKIVSTEEHNDSTYYKAINSVGDCIKFRKESIGVDVFTEVE